MPEDEKWYWTGKKFERPDRLTPLDKLALRMTGPTFKPIGTTYQRSAWKCTCKTCKHKDIMECRTDEMGPCICCVNYWGQHDINKMSVVRR